MTVVEAVAIVEDLHALEDVEDVTQTEDDEDVEEILACDID